MVQPILIDEDFSLEKIDPNFQPVFRMALPFLQTRKNKIHTYIAYQYALALLKQEIGTPEIAISACILHDVGWSAIPEKDQLSAFGPNAKDEHLKRKHETEGVAIAEKILLALNYEQLLIDGILNIIDGHDTTQQAKSPEDAIVKDADKLWRFSEIGFLIDIERFESQPIPYLKYLQDAVGKWFLTETGKQIAGDELHMREKEIMRQHPFDGTAGGGEELN
jgi:HD superfamily phosphodiesterase